MLNKFLNEKAPQQRVVLTRSYMPRIHEVQAPCQWLKIATMENAQLCEAERELLLR